MADGTGLCAFLQMFIILNCSSRQLLASMLSAQPAPPESAPQGCTRAEGEQEGTGTDSQPPPSLLLQGFKTLWRGAWRGTRLWDSCSKEVKNTCTTILLLHTQAVPLPRAAEGTVRH